MGNRPTLTFSLQARNKLLQTIRTIGAPTVLLSVVLLLIRPSTMPVGSASYQFAGSLHLPKDSSSPDLVGIRMLAYSDQDQNGKVSDPDLLVGSSSTDSNGHFFLHIEETRTSVSHIREERDDAWEDLRSGKVFVASRFLPSEVPTERISGFRFRGIFVPPNAVITEAYLQITASDNMFYPHSFQISAQQSAHPRPFNVGLKELSQRAKSSIHIPWEFNKLVEGKKYQSPDISSLVVPIIQRADWRSGREMVFLLKGNQWLLPARNWQGKGARLVIHYSLPESPFLLIADTSTLPPLVHVPSHHLSHQSDTSLRIPTYFSPKSPLRKGIAWEHFIAKHTSGEVELSWRYPQPTKQLLFEILRSSNGINYERIGTLLGKDSNSQKKGQSQVFTFLDPSPTTSQSSILAYRVRASTPSGQSSYSKVVKVQIEPNESPLFLGLDGFEASASLQVSYFSKHPGPAQLEVIDITGQTFQQLPVESTPQIQTLTLWTTEWPKGLYYLHLQHGSNSVMKPYVVK